MSDESFEAVKIRIDKFELSEMHTLDDWQSFMNDGIELLNHPEEQMKEYAVERMQKALWSENVQKHRQPGFVPTAAEQRLPPILDAVAKQDSREMLLLRFIKWASFSDEQKEVLSHWLTSANAKGLLSADGFAIAKVQSEMFSKTDWNEAKSFLEPFFDHPNDLLRAAAAFAFGEMYGEGADGLPPLDETMQKVKDWEINRPGFAGAFIGPLLYEVNDDGCVARSDINLPDWMLEIIAKRKGDEPNVPFYNGIDFHAHELLSHSPESVRKLIDFGSESVAAMAATKIDQPIAGMQELLEELVGSSDDFVSRVCSWRLANSYRRMHPEAERRGYVQLAAREDVDIFLVFNPTEQASRPYAPTIYPKGFFNVG